MIRRVLASARRGQYVVSIVALAAAVLGAAIAEAQTDNRWIGPHGGDFDNKANWSLGAVPTTSNTVVFDLGTSITSYYAGATRDVDALRIDAGLFVLDLGDPATRLRTTNNTLGVQIGTIDHQEATLVLRNGGLTDLNDAGAVRSIGSSPAATGTVIVSLDGSWLRSNSNTAGLLVGDVGTGTLIVERNGVASAPFVAVGNYGQGALSIKDDGKLSVQTDILVGRQFGGTGNVVVSDNGVLEQTAADSTLSIGGNTNSAQGSGSVEIRNFGVVDLGAGSSVDVWAGGTLNLAGGVLRADKLNLRGGAFTWTGGRIQGASGGNMDLVTVGGDDLQRSSLSLVAGNDLTLDQSLTVSAFGTVEIAGGKLSVGTISNAGAFRFKSGELEVRSQALSLGAGQLLGSAATLATGDRLAVTQGLTVTAGSRLTLAGGTAAGGTLTNAGLISGTGRVESKLENGATGQVMVRSGDWLHFAAATDTHSNLGDLFLDNGTVQFDQPLNNGATGRILGRGELLLGQGLTSSGLMHFDAGVTDVHGNVDLVAGARTIVSAGGTATFFDNVKNNGDQFTVRSGAAAVFVGTLSGKGIDGPGDVVVDGTLSPGNSPGSMSFGGSLTLGPDSFTKIEIAGFTPGLEYDQVKVAGPLKADGELAITIDATTQAALTTGKQFQLLDFASASGNFAQIDLPNLAGPLTWATSTLLNNGKLQVISQVAGDADGNGRTDLGDFGLLKASFGAGGATWAQGDFDLDGKVSLSDFGVLKVNFGATGAAAVPEPSTLLLAAAGAAMALLGIRRKR